METASPAPPRSHLRLRAYGTAVAPSFRLHYDGLCDTHARDEVRLQSVRRQDMKAKTTACSSSEPGKAYRGINNCQSERKDIATGGQQGAPTSILRGPPAQNGTGGAAPPASLASALICGLIKDAVLVTQRVTDLACSAGPLQWLRDLEGASSGWASICTRGCHAALST